MGNYNAGWGAPLSARLCSGDKQEGPLDATLFRPEWQSSIQVEAATACLKPISWMNVRHSERDRQKPGDRSLDCAR